MLRIFVRNVIASLQVPPMEAFVTRGQTLSKTWLLGDVIVGSSLMGHAVISAQMDIGISLLRTQTDVKVFHINETFTTCNNIYYTSDLSYMIINFVLFLECTCDFRGIRSTAGCDMNTGDCACKANVIGRDCNQCKPEHYGLSKDDPLGCQPCDCDIGGAYDNN